MGNIPLLGTNGSGRGSSAAELAARTGTSDATVVRTARSLGYGGLRELKRAVTDMLTTRRDPALVLDQRLERLSGTRVFDQVLSDSVDLLRGLPEVLDAGAFDTAVRMVEAAGRTVAYGIGPASATARYFADDLLGIGGDDAVVVFAPLRLFREIDALLDHAAEVGAPVVVVTEAVRDRVEAVLTTPPSTSGAASENLASWLVAHALTMELAARDRTGSVAAHQRLNRLRRAVAGAEIDTDVTDRGGAAEGPGGARRPS
ncbi:MurR/RpiR family transcriptional regulator [Nocardiopsis sp. M1B1]|uniref:MurR/RpiR family transcriptional regulator n=1 Tax=Nocardiopsis sp. M1B1 TaxID=3450454 RepID=UPI00403A1E7C